MGGKPSKHEPLANHFTKAAGEYPLKALQWYREWFESGFHGPIATDSVHTWVKIYVGQGGESRSHVEEGDLPAITLYDEAGRRYGHWSGNIDTKVGNYYVIGVKAAKGLENVKPTYMSLTSTRQNDICVSAVMVTWFDGSASAWSGDIATACGYAIGISNTAVGGRTYRPNCVWIDGNHKHQGNVPQGISFHLPDFQVTAALEQQYRLLPDTLCSSPARMAKRDKTSWKDPVRMFRPPLRYNPDGTDQDIERVLSNHESEGWTDDFHKSHQHPDGQGGRDWRYPAASSGRSLSPRLWSRFWRKDLMAKQTEHDARGEEIADVEEVELNGAAERLGAVTENDDDEQTDKTDNEGTEYDENEIGDEGTDGTAPAEDNNNGRYLFENTIVVSNHTRHSAIGVCGNDNFYGPNMVSLQEQIYCDMMSRQVYPTCNTERTWSCYDLQTSQLRGSETHIVGGPRPGNGLALIGHTPHVPIVHQFTNILEWS